MAQIAAELSASPAPRLGFRASLPTWRIVLWLGAMTALAGVVAASYLAYTGSVATATYAIQRLEIERDLWRTRNDQLRAELSKQRSLTWVEHQAASRLGMRKADPPIYLPIDGYTPPSGVSAPAGR